MRVQTEEWQRFIPGVRMYKGKKTLFYNGEILWDSLNGEYLVYDWEERSSWEVIIVLPGVEVIPEWTFHNCDNVEIVVMSDSVRRIEHHAFDDCKNLEFVKLSRNLEYIGEMAFRDCDSLPSIFIPPSCTEIGDWAFFHCDCLTVLGMPQNVQLGERVFQTTALIKKSPLELDEDDFYDDEDDETIIQWIKSINNGEAYALHRACASYNPLSEVLHDLVKRQGIESMKIPNAIGVTPSQYLVANPFATISEKEIINKYILDMMGEIV